MLPPSLPRPSGGLMGLEVPWVGWVCGRGLPLSGSVAAQSPVVSPLPAACRRFRDLLLRSDRCQGTGWNPVAPGGLSLDWVEEGGREIRGLNGGPPRPTASGKAARLPPCLQLGEGQNPPTRELVSCTPCSHAQSPFKCMFIHRDAIRPTHLCA